MTDRFVTEPKMQTVSDGVLIRAGRCHCRPPFAFDAQTRRVYAAVATDNDLGVGDEWVCGRCLRTWRLVDDSFKFGFRWVPAS
jgi:hypothetical protein